MVEMRIGARLIIPATQLQALIDRLAAEGYRVVAPRVRDGAIVYDAIDHVEQLPQGWTDRQEAAAYRLERRADSALFGFAAGAQSWKRFLHPPLEGLWRMRRGGSAAEPVVTTERFAFLGVRACELAAIHIQDRVLLGGAFRDAAYARRRAENFIVAVNCAEAAGTCFCASMRTGPAVRSGFDLALTELLRAEHEFLVEVGSERGAGLLGHLQHREAVTADIEAGQAVLARTAARMGRTLDTEGIGPLLQTNPEHPRWDDIAQRCLGCGNCTMVCPTCFCTTVSDRTDLAGEWAVRERTWDSCFTLDFSYLHGGSVRQQTRARYRQWMTHKLSYWIDQFGTSGCVGCGRCITWCPVGIDITVESALIRASANVPKSLSTVATQSSGSADGKS